MPPPRRLERLGESILRLHPGPVKGFVSQPSGTVRAVLLALDLDGVVVDLGPGIAARVADRFGVVVHPAGWRRYDLGDLPVPANDRRRFLADTFADPALYEAAPPCAGALAGVRALVAAGWRVVAVTARATHLEAVTAAWLRRHAVPVEDVHHVPVLTKAGAARAVGASASLEDNPDEAEALGAVCDSWLLHRRYNAWHEPVRCRRVPSWDDAVGRLCQLRLFA